MDNIAAIDLGSHTARLLIAKKRAGFEPLLRKRSYIYLGKDFDPALKRISGEASARAAMVLEDFSRIIGTWGVKQVVAVATGLVRRAANGREFLKEIFEKSGIHVTVLSGEMEARLSAKGALGALGVKDPPFFVFDLGGGTTEFLCHEKEGLAVNSVPLGAMVLTNAFLASDPPAEEELEALQQHIDRMLSRTCPTFGAGGPVIGTGGTVAALLALQKGISLDDIVPEKINGLPLALFEVESCLEKMRRLTTAQRIERLGLDSGRAEVLVAGAVAVTRLLCHLKANGLLVSMSDLLEGVLMDFLEGEENGKK